MKKWIKVKRRFLLSGTLLACAAFGLALAGCGGSGTASTSSTQVEQYFGTQNENSTSTAGGVWTATLDAKNNYFSYLNIDSDYVALQNYSAHAGNSAVATEGILDLTLFQAATGSGGYAVNLPGEGVLLRGGDKTTDIVGATISNTCPSLAAQETFNFVALGTEWPLDQTEHVAYGSVQIAENNVTNWTFSNLKMNTLSGTALSPTPYQAGSCGTTLEGYVITAPAQFTTPTGNVQINTHLTVGISPSGLLTIDQGQADNLAAINAPGQTGPMGLVGVVQPASALSVSDMVGKTYAGFESDPLGPLGTVAAVFGTTPGTGTEITGGTFPNDDVTKTPATNTTFDFGSQSSQTPGLFPSVTFTGPDTYGYCTGTSSGGTDAHGNPTCIFHGVAVAGQVGGKYVIFANLSDPTLTPIKNQYGQSTTPLAVLNILLYQQ